MLLLAVERFSSSPFFWSTLFRLFCRPVNMFSFCVMFCTEALWCAVNHCQIALKFRQPTLSKENSFRKFLVYTKSHFNVLVKCCSAFMLALNPLCSKIPYVALHAPDVFIGISGFQRRFSTAEYGIIHTYVTNAVFRVPPHVLYSQIEVIQWEGE